MYTDTIKSIHPFLDHHQAVGIECAMRAEYGTLDHLSRRKIAEEIEMALLCEEASPGYFDLLISSYGRESEVA